MHLAPGFEFAQATSDDVGELFTVWNEALVDHAVWHILFKDCDPKEVQPWLVKTFGPRWTMDDITMWKITELSSGKIVAWTALQYPWKYRASITDEQKRLVQATDLPPLLGEMNELMFKEIVKAMGGPSTCGYDPENDYHRKGTNVLPGYQRLGFGKFLTRHCNDISDSTAGRTWIPATPRGYDMFKSLGYKEVKVLDAHVEDYGLENSEGKFYVTVREPLAS